MYLSDTSNGFPFYNWINEISRDDDWFSSNEDEGAVIMIIDIY